MIYSIIATFLLVVLLIDKFSYQTRAEIYRDFDGEINIMIHYTYDEQRNCNVIKTGIIWK